MILLKLKLKKILIISNSLKNTQKIFLKFLNFILKVIIDKYIIKDNIINKDIKLKIKMAYFWFWCVDIYIIK